MNLCGGRLGDHWPPYWDIKLVLYSRLYILNYLSHGQANLTIVS